MMELPYLLKISVVINIMKGSLYITLPTNVFYHLIHNILGRCKVYWKNKMEKWSASCVWTLEEYFSIDKTKEIIKKT